MNIKARDVKPGDHLADLGAVRYVHETMEGEVVISGTRASRSYPPDIMLEGTLNVSRGCPPPPLSDGLYFPAKRIWTKQGQFP